MTAGRLAAATAIDSIAAGDFSAGFLHHYEAAWRQGEGRKNQRNYRLRTRFSAEQRLDEHFVRAFALAVGG